MPSTRGVKRPPGRNRWVYEIDLDGIDTTHSVMKTNKDMLIKLIIWLFDEGFADYDSGRESDYRGSWSRAQEAVGGGFTIKVKDGANRYDLSEPNDIIKLFIRYRKVVHEKFWTPPKDRKNSGKERASKRQRKDAYDIGSDSESEDDIDGDDEMGNPLAAAAKPAKAPKKRNGYVAITFPAPGNEGVTTHLLPNRSLVLAALKEVMPEKTKYVDIVYVYDNQQAVMVPIKDQPGKLQQYTLDENGRQRFAQDHVLVLYEISETRKKPSPPGPNALPGTTATCSSRSSFSAKTSSSMPEAWMLGKA